MRTICLTFWTAYQSVLNKGRLGKEMQDMKISVCKIKMCKIIATRYKILKDKGNMTIMKKIIITDSNNRRWMTKKERMKLKVKENTMKMKIKTKNIKRSIRSKLIIMKMANSKATSIKMVKWTNNSNSNLVQMNNNWINNS